MNAVAKSFGTPVMAKVSQNHRVAVNSSFDASERESPAR
jgi:hypothetical protein